MSDEFDAGVERTWDDEPCPRDGCEGELQQQDDYNVMCLECEDVFVHVTDESKHYLTDQDHTTAAEKEKLVTDGGYLTDCDECGFPLRHGENVEMSSGTYCERCAEGRDEEPIVADGGQEDADVS
jgi:hypothetical protein